METPAAEIQRALAIPEENLPGVTPREASRIYQRPFAKRIKSPENLAWIIGQSI